MAFSDACLWIDEHVEEMVALQEELTKRVALGPENGGEGEWEKARFLEDYLDGCGFPAPQHYDCPDERVPEGSRPNMLVTLGDSNSHPAVFVMTHLDVVPPGKRLPDGGWKGWDSDPFQVKREGDRLYGRGVEDNQQSMVASVFAVRALLETETALPQPASLLVVSEEETGSAYGLTHVLENYPELFSTDDIIIVPDGGNDEGTLIEIAEKSVLWLHFHVDGKQSHGSMPAYGVNAFRAASRLVCRLDEVLRGRFDAEESLYSPPESTFEPTLHEENVPNVNTIPGEDHFCFDCRILPREDMDEVLETIREVCAGVDQEVGTNTELSVQHRLDAPEPTPQDAPVVRGLEKALAEVAGVEGEPRGIGGSTVAAVFRARGYPSAVWATVEGMAHQANEYSLIPNMVNDAKVFAHVFLQQF